MIQKRVFLLTVTLLSAASLPASAALLVYEGFNYGTASATRAGADQLHGQPDGINGDADATGLSGTWEDTAGAGDPTSLFMYAGSLSFSDLATSGNSVRSDTNSNNDIFGRTITADLDSGGELWFSFMANKLQNNFSAAEGGLVIGNQRVNNSRVLSDAGTSGLQGFGIAPTTAGNDWTPYAWNGSAQSVGDAAYGVAINGSQTNLLIGHVSWNTGAGGADEFTAYYYSGAGSISADMSNLTAIASTIEVNVDETTLDFLSLTRQVNTAYDEIRVATTLDEVLGIPEPSVALLGGLGTLFLLRRRRR